jgi:hypothetical protein
VNKKLLVWYIVAFFGISTLFVTRPGPAIVPAQTFEPLVIETSALERGRQATFDMYKPGVNSGTAVLISRIRDGDEWLYRAMTAYHVISDIEDDATFRGILTFQPSFHGEPLILDVEHIGVGQTLPAYDWATVEFRHGTLLQCADVATRADFINVKSFETIYAVGCAASFGQQLREGIISSTHNHHVSTPSYPHRQWNTSPRNFFKVSFPIWYGDSGGPVFTKHGKVIGIINAFTIGGGFQAPLTHSGVSVKIHTIREFVSVNKDFFKVEN